MKNLLIYPLSTVLLFGAASYLLYLGFYHWALIPLGLMALVLSIALCAVIHQQRAVAALISTQTQLLMEVMRSTGIDIQTSHRG